MDSTREKGRPLHGTTLREQRLLHAVSCKQKCPLSKPVVLSVETGDGCKYTIETQKFKVEK